MNEDIVNQCLELRRSEDPKDRKLAAMAAVIVSTRRQLAALDKAAGDLQVAMAEQQRQHIEEIITLVLKAGGDVQISNAQRLMAPEYALQYEYNDKTLRHTYSVAPHEYQATLAEAMEAVK